MDRMAVPVEIGGLEAYWVHSLPIQATGRSAGGMVDSLAHLCQHLLVVAFSHLGCAVRDGGHVHMP